MACPETSALLNLRMVLAVSIPLGSRSEGQAEIEGAALAFLALEPYPAAEPPTRQRHRGIEIGCRLSAVKYLLAPTANLLAPALALDVQ